jgi:hypothetical protein
MWSGTTIHGVEIVVREELLLIGMGCLTAESDYPFSVSFLMVSTPFKL